ncbi:MAG: rod shape-determining protein [Clostridia bacterium]|nr:rod shape-determining protein [Clostridia bacterium]
MPLSPAGSNHAKRTPKTKAKKVIELEKHTEEAQAVMASPASEEIIFALDIGTRTVVGIAGTQENDKFKVLAAETLEHKNRAMMDGQIHDIAQVAKLAGEVRDRLEKKLGFKLTKVAIAAAGRVLRTCEVKVEREIEQGLEIDKQMISRLEMEGIQMAQAKLDQEIMHNEKTQYYCVGYSVINYYLNGFVISSLAGHRGRFIGAEILATFLPHVVVDSLYTVMSRIGLEVASLTLEPIAAINVTIPRDLRLLNLALVDIGAGTSDIAITRDGSVVAYAMAPVAGDEITECIAQHYLLDFNTSEKIKVSLTSGTKEISFTDILGVKRSVSSSEVLEVIRPAVVMLAETISQRILEYNHKAPNAVFLIGGGSQVPGLTDLIAGYLKLAKERVVVRGREVIKNIKFSGKKLSGPEAITPLGIAVTAQMQQGQDFLAVTINGKKIRLFNSRKLSVSDALVLIGYDAAHLIGRSGKSIRFEINGETRLVKGGYGKAAEIYVNDKPASLTTILKVGDNIEVKPAEDGENASARLSEIIKDYKTGKAKLNGNIIQIGTMVYINGKEVYQDEEIKDGDVLLVNRIITLKDLLADVKVNFEDNIVLVNGQSAGMHYELNDGDEIEYKLKEQEDAQSKLPVDNEIKEFSDPMDSGIEQDKLVQGISSLLPDKFSVVVNGKAIEIEREKNEYMFIDIFNYISFDLSKPRGNIVLKLNGRQAGFTDRINHGDIIEIYWDK